MTTKVSANKLSDIFQSFVERYVADGCPEFHAPVLEHANVDPLFDEPNSDKDGFVFEGADGSKFHVTIERVS